MFSSQLAPGFGCAVSDGLDLGFMTLVEASAAVRTPVRTLRFWIAQGRLQAFRPGKKVLVRRADLLRLVESSAC